MFTHAIVLDFEATCDDVNRPDPQEIIEFPSVLMSLETLETVDSFEAFVRPVHHPQLTDFCKELTAIRQADVDGADIFPDVMTRHANWIEGHGLTADTAVIVTCGDWDLNVMLPAQCPVSDPPVEALDPIYTRWQNVKALYCDVLEKRKAPGMAGMLRDLGIPLKGHHHRGIDDSHNIARLYGELIGRGGAAEVTGAWSTSKYPPISIRLRLADRVENSRLETRSVVHLHGLAGRLFKSRAVEIRRANGAPIWQDDDLFDLAPGEELTLAAD